jgi:hypothetical protein
MESTQHEHVKFVTKPIHKGGGSSGLMLAADSSALSKSPIVPIIACVIIAFVLLGRNLTGGSSGKMPVQGTVGGENDADAPPIESKNNGGGSTDVDFTRALAPVLAVGILVLAAKSGKLPENASLAIGRLFESDLVAIFLTIAYAHYIFNYEQSHLDSDELFYDALFRIGALVASIWLARRILR